MKSYLLKLSGREQGPYSESQIGQMFADQQVNRSPLFIEILLTFPF